MNEFLVSQLQARPGLMDLLAGGIHEVTSLGIGPKVPVPQRPYMVYKELPSQAYRAVDEITEAERRTFQFFVYDEKGSFDRINLILRHVKAVVKGPLKSFWIPETGIRCFESEWGGLSQNIEDDGYESCARYGIAYFIVSEPVPA